MNIEEKMENAKKIYFLNIQDRIILSQYVVIDDLTAFSMYRELKKLKLGGGTSEFNQKCAQLIKEKSIDVCKEPEKPKSPIMSVQVYIDDKLVKKSITENLWLNVMRQILDEERKSNDVDSDSNR